MNTENLEATAGELTSASDAMDAALERLDKALEVQAARSEELAALKQELEDLRNQCEALTRENADLATAFANSEKKRLKIEALNKDTSQSLDTAIDQLQTILAAA